MLAINELESHYDVFEIDEEIEDFKKIDVVDNILYRILNPTSIFLFIDHGNKKVWIWNGRHAGIRKKFIATQAVSNVRDNYAVDYQITAIDDGSEDLEFKVFLGLD